LIIVVLIIFSYLWPVIAASSHWPVYESTCTSIIAWFLIDGDEGKIDSWENGE